MSHWTLSNVFAQLGAHITGLIVPLVLIPFLARELSADAWGRYALVTVLASLVGIFAEGGTNLAASRRILRRDSQDERADAVLEAVCARLMIAALLAGTAFVGAILHAAVVRAFGVADVADYAVLTAALFLGVASGNNLIWFFQATNQLRRHAMIEVASRVLTLMVTIALTLLWDSWYAPVLGANLGVLASVTVGALHVRRYVSRAGGRQGLLDPIGLIKESIPLVTSRGLIAGYNAGIPLLLGAIAGTNALGGYYLAERPIRAIVGTFGPVLQSLYALAVKAAHTIVNGPLMARTPLHLWVTAISLAGTAGTLALFALAPQVVSVLGGSEFSSAEDAVLSLRVLAFVPILAAANATLAVLVLIPLGHDKSYRNAVSTSLLMALIVSVPMMVSYGAVGAAAGVLVAEVVNLLMLTLAVARARK